MKKSVFKTVHELRTFRFYLLYYSPFRIEGAIISRLVQPEERKWSRRSSLRERKGRKEQTDRKCGMSLSLSRKREMVGTNERSGARALTGKGGDIWKRERARARARERERALWCRGECTRLARSCVCARALSTVWSLWSRVGLFLFYITRDCTAGGQERVLLACHSLGFSF